MKRNDILELINKGVIDLNKDSELESFIKFSSEEVKPFFEISDRDKIEFLKEFYFSDIISEKKHRIIRMINKLQNKELVLDFVNLLMDFSKDKLWNLVDENIQLIDFKEKLEAIRIVANNLSSDMKFSDIVRKILNVKDVNVVNLYISLLSDENLKDSVYYGYVIGKLTNIFDFDRLYSLIDLVTDADFLESNDFKYVLNKALSINNDEVLKAFCSIVYTPSFMDFASYRYLIDYILEIKNVNVLWTIDSILDEEVLEEEQFEIVVKTIPSVDDKILRDFKKLALDSDALGSEHYSFLLDALCEIKNPNLSALFVDIATKENVLNSDNCIDIISIVSKITNRNTILFVNRLLDDEDFINSENMMYVLKKILKNQNRVYSESFSYVLIDVDLLNNTIYLSIIDELFKIHDESIIKTLSDFLSWDGCDLDNDEISELYNNAIKIKDINFLREYLDMVTIDDIREYDEFDLIFTKALAFKSYKLLRMYKKLVLYMIYEDRFDFEYVLDNVVKIKDEVRFEYFTLIIKDKDMANNDYLNYVILCFGDVNIQCLPYFIDIVLDKSVMELTLYSDLVGKLSRIKNVEEMKLLDDLLNTDYGVDFISKAINIQDVRVLKDLCLLFDDINGFVLDGEISVSKFNNIVTSYLDKSKNNSVLKNLIRSNNSVVCKYKGILYNYFDISNGDLMSEVSDIISVSEMNVIKEELYNLTIMYGQVSLGDMIKVGTYQDVMDSLKDMDEDVEVSDKVLVKKLK